MAAYIPALKDRILCATRSHQRQQPTLNYRPSVYKHWSSDSMDKALDAVLNKDWSIRHASESYSVPRSTLGDRVSGCTINHTKSGPKKILTDEEEEVLVNFLIGCATVGYAKTRAEVMTMINQLNKSRGLVGTVSSGWWEGFSKRHPCLTLRIAPCLSQQRHISSHPTVLNQYFDVLEETLTEYDLMKKPNCIFNMDETGVAMEPDQPKGIFLKEERRPMMLSSGLKGQFTVVGCVSAAGFCLPPFVIIDRKRFNPAFAEGEVPGTAYGLSHNGWMDQELFHLWFKDHFLKYIPTTRPVILLMDGHRSHYNPETIRFASKNGVVLFTLPPNTTHMSQPLDRSCFGPLKTAWREVCHRFMCNSGQTVSRFSFSHLLHEAWDIAMTRKNIISGFKVTGIFPFDRKALVPEPEDDTSPYLPLLTPRRHTNRRVIVDDVTLDNSHFSNDISDSSFESSLTLLPRRSSFSEMLRYPSPIPVPKSNPQSKESRVLTSDENLKRIEEKEREREEIAKEKARKKELREQRKLDKANNNKKRVINDKSDDKADPVTCDQFSAEEIQLFRKRFDNGYDLEHDARYNEWKKKFAMQHDSLEQSSNESTYEDWMFTHATAEKTPDTLTQPRCTLKKTALGNDVIDSWHRSDLRKPATNDGIIMEKAECTVCHGYYAVTSSGTIRLHGPQSDRCPGSRQPVGIESDLSNSPVTPPLPSSPSPHQPHSVDLEKTSSIVKQLPNTATNNDIIKPTSIRTLKKTSTSTNGNTQPKLTLRNNATNDDTHKKTAAIDDITQPRRTFKKTATDSRKETTTNNDITQPRHRTATGSLKKTATNDDITQPRHRTATGSLKKTATNDDITQPRRTLRTVTNFLKKTAANDDITQPKCTVKPATSLKKTAANNDLKCTLKKCKHPYAQNWIQCSVCEAWHHCICMETTLKKAEKITFTCCQ